MIFEAGHEAIADRRALRNQVRQACGALEKGARELRDISGAAPSELQAEPLEPTSDVSGTIAHLQALASDITALKHQRQALEADLVTAREKQARLRKNMLMAVIILVVMIAIYSAI